MAGHNCLHGLAVLVVEDEPALAALAVHYLEGLGCRVDEAPSLSVAMALLASRTYAAVLTDLQLTRAGRDEGLEVVRVAAATDPKPLIVLWTGGGSPNVDEEGALQLGADAYLQKPAGLRTFTTLLLERLAPAHH